MSLLVDTDYVLRPALASSRYQADLRRAVAAMGAPLPDFPASPVIRLYAQADAQLVHQQGERRRVAGRAHAPGLVAKRLRLSQQRQRYAAEATLKGEHQRKEEIAARVRFHLRQIYGRHGADMLLSVSHSADGTPPADSRHV